MVVLGAANSRLKDYYDLLMLPRTLELDGPTLAEAIERTFARRGTAIPADRLESLSDDYVQSPLNRSRWRALLRKGALTAVEGDLPAVVEEIRRFAEPLLAAARDGLAFDRQWTPAGGWR